MTDTTAAAHALAQDNARKARNLTEAEREAERLHGLRMLAQRDQMREDTP